MAVEVYLLWLLPLLQSVRNLKLRLRKAFIYSCFYLELVWPWINECKDAFEIDKYANMLTTTSYTARDVAY